MQKGVQRQRDLGPGIVAICIVDFVLQSEDDLEDPMLAMWEQMDNFRDRVVEVLVESQP